MTRWTPGPWSIDPRSSTHVVAGNRGVAHCGGYSSNTDGGEHLAEDDANARLVAAAPDLYEQLRICAAKFREYQRLHEAKGTPDGAAKAITNMRMADNCDAALAKARGEAQ